MFIKYCAFFLKGLRIAKIYIFVIPPKTKLMPPILVSWEAPFRSNLPKFWPEAKKYKFSFLLCAGPL